MMASCRSADWVRAPMCLQLCTLGTEGLDVSLLTIPGKHDRQALIKPHY